MRFLSRPVRSTLVTGMVVLSVGFSSLAHAGWWNKDWTARTPISLDTTPKGIETREALENVPVLIRLHTGNFSGFFSMKEGAADLRFTDGDDKSPLPFHIEKFDPVNEIALIWVQVPKLAAGKKGEFVAMYYGNANASPAEDAAATYDPHQALVLHFDAQDAAGIRDKSAKGSHPSKSSAVINPAGFIGASARFNGKQQISVPPSPALQVSTEKGWTFSTWIRLEGQQKDATVFDARGGNQSLALVVDGVTAFARLTQAGKQIETGKSKPLSPGGWHHLAMTVTADRLMVFVDGEEAAQLQTTVATFDPALSLGADAGGKRGLIGELDEVAVATVARSSDWIRLAAKSQAAGSNFVTVSKDEPGASSGGGSYFGTILANVTVDGWAVIVLMVILGVVSWMVMVRKWKSFKLTQEDNARFLKDYQRVAGGDPASLDRDDDDGDKSGRKSSLLGSITGKHDHYQNSTLYHLYHAGMQDIKARLHSTAGAKARGLSSQAIASVRATVDAAMVRESQKLNAGMVWLTIAISGGPFLGLLGTVIGVMITFAAIAASGDVNINAIAPGIAAALVATVAGLMVAIPALFGYNYLTTQMRDLNGDMRVYVDQFLTLISERYEC